MKSRDLLIAEAVRDAFVEAMIDYFGKDDKSLRLIKVVDLPAIISSVPALEPYCYVVSGCSIPFYGEFAENDAKQEVKRVGGTCEAIPLYAAPPAGANSVATINMQLLDALKHTSKCLDHYIDRYGACPADVLGVYGDAVRAIAAAEKELK